MSQAQFLTAAADGLGVFKSAAGSLADSTLLQVLGLIAFPQGFYGTFEIKIVSGTVFFTNDGTAATANSYPMTAGEIREIKNCNAMASKLHFFANAAYDMRIALYSGGTP